MIYIHPKKEFLIDLKHKHITIINPPNLVIHQNHEVKDLA